MNKRKYIKEGINTNLKALLNSVPGALIPMANPQTDIKEEDVKDVTASAYEEQDRINVDYDDLSGQFSTSGVQSNRSLNETVGGLNIMSQGANQLTEYTLKIFSETWVKPTLKQLMRMEALYETDEVIMTAAARKAGLAEVLPEVPDETMIADVSVGMGAVNPAQKIEKFTLALQTIAQALPQYMSQLNPEEVIKEVFGSVGYSDGKRFFLGMEEGGQGMQPPEQADPAELQAEVERERVAQDGQIRVAEMEQDMQMKQIEMAQERELEESKMANEMALEEERNIIELQTKREQNQLQAKQQQMNAQNQRKTGE